MKLLEAIDSFPTLRGIRVGVDSDDRRSWFFDELAFYNEAIKHGDGARVCAQFVISCAGRCVLRFDLAQMFSRIDTAHRAAALDVFTACLVRGGLQ